MSKFIIGCSACRKFKEVTPEYGLNLFRNPLTLISLDKATSSAQFQYKFSSQHTCVATFFFKILKCPTIEE